MESPCGSSLPLGDEVIECLNVRISGNDQSGEVVGHPGDRCDIAEVVLTVIERDRTDHHSAAGHQRVIAALLLDELAQSDRSAGTGDVDDLNIVDDSIGAQHLLCLAGESVPSSASGCWNDRSEVAPR